MFISAVTCMLHAITQATVLQHWTMRARGRREYYKRPSRTPAEHRQAITPQSIKQFRIVLSIYQVSSPTTQRVCPSMPLNRRRSPPRPLPHAPPTHRLSRLFVANHIRYPEHGIVPCCCCCPLHPTRCAHHPSCKKVPELSCTPHSARPTSHMLLGETT